MSAGNYGSRPAKCSDGWASGAPYAAGMALTTDAQRSLSRLTQPASAPHARPARTVRPSDLSSLGDGVVLERLALMRNACQALAFELADTRRQLRATQAELKRLGEPQSGR